MCIRDSLYLIYTSGSTGRPKGVVVSRRNAARLFTTAARHFDFRRDDVWTLFHATAFDFSVWELWGALAHGARLVLVPRTTARDPEAFAGLLRREGVTVLSQTPSALGMLLASRELETAPPDTLRYVVCGGEALRRETIEAFFRRFPQAAHPERAAPALINMYGITETTVHVTYHHQRTPEPGIGQPLADLTVHLVDPSLDLVPLGSIGEIAVGEIAVGEIGDGTGLAQGYHRRPALTACLLYTSDAADEN